LLNEFDNDNEYNLFKHKDKTDSYKDLNLNNLEYKVIIRGNEGNDKNNLKDKISDFVVDRIERDL